MRELALLTSSWMLKDDLRKNPPADLPAFLRFLNDCDTWLGSMGRRFILALDEYEMLDEKLQEGVLTTDLLATIRESIQTHRRIIWMFSGNADIVELIGADWTSYLISVRTLRVPFFSPDETSLLMTEPLKYSALQDEEKAASALFWKEFWGEDGIAQILLQSGGWPYFVQLIAETAVSLANESAPGARVLQTAVMEQALDYAVERGFNTFYQLLKSQSRSDEEWLYLTKFAQIEVQQAPEDPEILRLLKRRQLLMETSDGWHLRVPLMARWLRKEWS
jgi:hypothetical protein